MTYRKYDYYKPKYAKKTYLVQLLVELRQLGGLGHHFLVHHEWRLDVLVAPFAQELKAICDEGLVQVNAVVGQKVSSVSSDLCA